MLTFVADHSLMENCDAWGSGDSGLYPGASADLGEAVPLSERRFGTEIRNCDMHHNTLGYSGTDGNAVWVHNNAFYDNSEGFSTDVFTAPGHPGFPQDTDLLENNDFYSNNFNTYLPLCQGTQKPGPNGPSQGCSDVTPTEPVPVGTGMWIAGGNNNTIRNNRFWDNWRRGTMLFAVPDAFVCGDPGDQVAGCDPTTPGASATSYRNHSTTTRWVRPRTATPSRTASTSGGTRAGSSPAPVTAATAGTATPAPTGRAPASPASRRRAAVLGTTCRPIATTARCLGLSTRR